jgi:alpha-1,4-digalacturonate transport system substrate-binding protein
MKKLSLLLVLALVIAMFAGCGKKEEDTTVATEEKKEDVVTEDKEEAVVDEEKEAVVEPSGDPLKMLWWSDGTEGDVMQTILDDFKTETGIEIELVVLAYDDYTAKLKTMIRGGEAPALIRATEGTIMEFKEFLVPLDDVYNVEEYTNVFYNNAGEAVVLPIDVTANGLFVNYDLLDQYGVNYPKLGDDPWTWAEFETEMAKLMGQEGVAFPGVFDNKAHRFMPMVYQFGGKMWEEPYTKSGLTSDAAFEALSTLQRMNTNGTLDPSVWAGSGNPSELFKTGQYGFHMSGNWFVAAYQDLAFNWGVVQMPIGNGPDATRSTIIGGKGVCAVTDSGQEDEASQFIAYLAKGENHDKYTGGVPFLSPRLAADLDFGAYQEVYEVFQDELANTPVENVLDWQAEITISGVYPIINQGIEAAMGGNDVRETLDMLSEELIAKAAELGL